MLKKLIVVLLCGVLSLISQQRAQKTNSPKSYLLDSVTTLQPVQAIILGYLNSFDTFCSDYLTAAHTARILDLAFSPDGKHLASASADKTIKIWDCASGTCVKTLSGHCGTVYAIAWDPTGTRLASSSPASSQDGSIKIWDVFTEACIKTIPQKRCLALAVAWSPCGDYLATGDISIAALYSISIWDVATGNCVKTFKEHTKKINCLRFISSNGQLVSGSEDGMIKLWDITQNTESSLKTCKPKYVYGITALSVVTALPDRVAYASDSGTIGEIDINTGLQVSDLNKYTQKVHSIAHSPCGKYLISCAGRPTDYDGSRIGFWDTASGQQIDTFFPHNALVTLVSYSPCGNYIASAAVDNTIVIKKSQAKQLELAIK